MNLRIEPVTLEGVQVRLEPLSLAHLDGLCAVGLEPELWKWIPTQVRDREELRAYVDLALDERRRGVSMPFATLLKAEGRVVGSTRYGNVDLKNRRVEIGWTWIGKPWQRSAVNTEAKLLMLRHAFEVLGCTRVELKTDGLNEKSRNAILRLGARQEGILRKHTLTYSGRMRDTVYFSILDDEWPAVKAGLEAKLQR
jgi:RimJ/RimL family protein N-acetyltransferase